MIKRRATHLPQPMIDIPSHGVNLSRRHITQYLQLVRPPMSDLLHPYTITFTDSKRTHFNISHEKMPRATHEDEDSWVSLLSPSNIRS